MPTYEYLCINCEAITLKMRKISDRLDSCSCDQCGSPTSFKISTPAFSGSGAGWCGKMSDKGKSDVARIDTTNGNLRYTKEK